jgi:hypothetical protein
MGVFRLRSLKEGVTRNGRMHVTGSGEIDRGCLNRKVIVDAEISHLSIACGDPSRCTRL